MKKPDRQLQEQGWHKETTHARSLSQSSQKTRQQELAQDRPSGKIGWLSISLDQYVLPSAACAAAKRATGRRNGEQLT